MPAQKTLRSKEGQKMAEKVVVIYGKAG